MRALICGGRDYNDRAHFWSEMEKIERKWGKITVVIEGGALGADRMARAWGRAHGLPVLTVEADWDYYHKSAGPVRNNWMIKHCAPDMVIAFAGGSGTADMVSRAHFAEVQLIRAA